MAVPLLPFLPDAHENICFILLTNRLGFSMLSSNNHIVIKLILTLPYHLSWDKGGNIYLKKQHAENLLPRWSLKTLKEVISSCANRATQAFVRKTCDRMCMPWRKPTAFEECKISQALFYSENEILYQCSFVGF